MARWYLAHWTHNVADKPRDDVHHRSTGSVLCIIAKLTQKRSKASVQRLLVRMRRRQSCILYSAVESAQVV